MLRCTCHCTQQLPPCKLPFSLLSGRVNLRRVTRPPGAELGGNLLQFCSQKRQFRVPFYGLEVHDPIRAGINLAGRLLERRHHLENGCPAPRAQIVGHTTYQEKPRDEHEIQLWSGLKWMRLLKVCFPKWLPMSGVSKSLFSAAMCPSARSTTCM